MKIMILTADSNGGYPVPAVLGGGVSTLIEHLAAGNNEKQLCSMEIVSLYDEEAEKKALAAYPNIKFTWVKVPKILKLLDKFTFNFIRIANKNCKAISFRSLFSLVYYIQKSKRIVNKTDAEKIVIENNIPLVRVMRKSKFKGQWYYHLHNVPRIDAWCRDEFQKITKFLCVSRFVANQITGEKSAIGQIDPSKTAVLLNCVDTELFRPIDKGDARLAELRKQYGLREKDFVIVFVGRLAEEKGADKVLEAMKELPSNVKCLIVGSLLFGLNTLDAYQNRLHKLAKEFGNRVVFTGYIPQAELPYIYNLADAAVLPSMWDEPAGLTNIEAMACGIPVITTNSGGIPEYAYGAEIVSRTDKIASDIAEIISREFTEKRQLKHASNRQLIEDNFSKDSYIEKFVSILS